MVDLPARGCLGVLQTWARGDRKERGERRFEADVEIEEFDEVREKYPMLFLTARAPGHSVMPKKIFLDLAEANRRQLLAVRVPAKNISVSSLCTACRSDLLFSYRAEKGVTGRMMSVAGVRNSL